LGELNQLLRLDNILQLNAEERIQANYRKIDVVIDGRAGFRILWDEDFSSQLEMDTADFEKLLTLVDKRREWPRDQRTLGLDKKLKEYRDGIS